MYCFIIDVDIVNNRYMEKQRKTKPKSNSKGKVDYLRVCENYFVFDNVCCRKNSNDCSQLKNIRILHYRLMMSQSLMKLRRVQNPFDMNCAKS